jgi:hypothetical protein
MNVKVTSSRISRAPVMAPLLLLLISCETGLGQKFPSCVDNEANQKIVPLLTRFVENAGAGNPGVKLLSVQIEKIWPRNARFGNYSGILECEVTFSVILQKISTGQRFLQRINNFALYFGYNQNGELVVELPGAH